MIGVIVISPVPTVRAGLASVLRLGDDLRGVAEGRRIEDAPVLASAGAADVVLLDFADGDDPSEVVGALEGTDLGVVMLGATGSAGRLLRSGAGVAWGFLPRDATGERIVAALRAVAAGLVVLDPDAVAARVGSQLGDPLVLAAEPDDLTAREREVLGLVSLGLTNKAIARRLGISDSTAKFHVASILAKLGAESRTEAVHIGARRGLIAL